MVEHLLNVSDVLVNKESGFTVEEKRSLVQSVGEFSYDVVAAKSRFKEAKCAEIIVMTLLNVFPHQSR